ncbi:HTH-type transcriptional activator Btr [Paenibacillus konkukensis]|uniref:HTH-type transcriptional activator Btr n=1 Tax=Paenibacillus konkukensis TaxID=2020716 RepID=A0ABY4RV23_9BACL|nr:AraC family transcriptional regulator [Paenibacillus konkukensis]UQZ86145.1 HTH-type transcriptional activator Btr [Paenibacillus konkukensis]
MLNIHSCYVRDLSGKWALGRSLTPSYLLIFITSGRLVYHVDNEDYPLQKGDALLIPAGSFRWAKALEDHQRYAVFFEPTGDDKQLLPILSENRAYKLRLDNTAYFKQRLSILLHHWLQKGPYVNAACSAILMEVLSVINHELDHRGIKGKKTKMVKDIKNYIAAHYSDPLKLQDLSAYSGRTPNYITCAFKEVTGFTPIEYLHVVRVSVAKDLMLEKSMSVREISEKTGFCDQAYFNRVFKKVTGHSPTAFLHRKSG